MTRGEVGRGPPALVETRSRRRGRLEARRPLSDARGRGLAGAHGRLLAGGRAPLACGPCLRVALSGRPGPRTLPRGPTWSIRSHAVRHHCRRHPPSWFSGAPVCAGSVHAAVAAKAGPGACATFRVALAGPQRAPPSEPAPPVLSRRALGRDQRRRLPVSPPAENGSGQPGARPCRRVGAGIGNAPGRRWHFLARVVRAVERDAFASVFDVDLHPVPGGAGPRDQRLRRRARARVCRKKRAQRRADVRTPAAGGGA